MSISHKKINQMIEVAVRDFSAFGHNLKAFEDICKKIYLIESSSNDSSSSMKLISEIREEILLRSSDLKEDTI